MADLSELMPPAEETLNRYNFKKPWRWIKKNRRKAGVMIKNLSDAPLRCRYLARVGAVLPAGGDYEPHKLRNVSSFTAAIKYYEKLRSDTASGLVDYDPPEEPVVPENSDVTTS